MLFNDDRDEIEKLMERIDELEENVKSLQEINEQRKALVDMVQRRNKELKGFNERAKAELESLEVLGNALYDMLRCPTDPTEFADSLTSWIPAIRNFTYNGFVIKDGKEIKEFSSPLSIYNEYFLIRRMTEKLDKVIGRYFLDKAKKILIDSDMVTFPDDSMAFKMYSFDETTVGELFKMNLVYKALSDLADEILDTLSETDPDMINLDNAIKMVTGI